MIRKVRGLLETAESYAAAGNDEAAETYTSKAHQLLSKHGLDMAMVKDSGAKPEAVISRTLVAQGKHWIRWSNLAHLVAMSQGVRTIHAKVRTDPTTKKRYDRYVATVIDVIGFESDVDAVELLWTSLMVQAASAMDRAMDECPSYVNKWTFQINFLDGFLNVVYDRLRKLRADAVKEREVEEQGNLLPVLQDRKLRVDEKVNEKYGRLRKGAATGARTSSSGRQAGAVAGRSASIGGTSLPSSRKGLGR